MMKGKVVVMMMGLLAGSFCPHQGGRDKSIRMQPLGSDPAMKMPLFFCLDEHQAGLAAARVVH